MKALALVEAPNHVCCRHRVKAFEKALARAGWSLSLRGLASGGAARWLQFASLPRVDTVFLQRKLLSPWHLGTLRGRARRLIFDFDDAVLFRDSYDPRGPHCHRRARRFAATVRVADLVIAGNDFLADCALRAGARPERVRVIPTCVATEAYAAREDGGSYGVGLELVWVGASSTLRGLERTRPLWDRVAREVPGVRMRVICDRFPDLGAMPIVPVVWSEASEAREIASGDVGIAIMPEGAWSRGKCGLKVLQYQAAGLPVLANPVGVHCEMVHPGSNGFLPAGDSEWVAAARALAGDAGLRRRMGQEARRSVEAGYSVAAWEGAFVAALAGSPVLTAAAPAPRNTARKPHGAQARGEAGPKGRRPGEGERAEPRAGLERNGGMPA